LLSDKALNCGNTKSVCLDFCGLGIGFVRFVRNWLLRYSPHSSWSLLRDECCLWPNFSLLYPDAFYFHWSISLLGCLLLLHGQFSVNGWLSRLYLTTGCHWEWNFDHYQNRSGVMKYITEFFVKQVGKCTRNVTVLACLPAFI